MTTPVIYLASPIDHVHKAKTKDQQLLGLWRQEARNGLANKGAMVYDPATAFKTGKGIKTPPGPVWSINQHALENCAGVIAVWPEGIESTGVPLEINHAWVQGIPTALVTDDPDTTNLARWDGRASLRLITNSVQIALDWLVEKTDKGIDDEPPDAFPPYCHTCNMWHADVCPYERTRQEAQQQLFDDQVAAIRTREHYKLKVIGKQPVRQHADDAGFDMFANEDMHLWPQGGTKDVSCGFNCQLPDGFFGLVLGRSGLLRERGIHVVPSVIDTGYRGPMKVAMWSERHTGIVKGERVAQLVILPNISMKTEIEKAETTGLDTSERGNNGFGSTGVS